MWRRGHSEWEDRNIHNHLGSTPTRVLPFKGSYLVLSASIYPTILSPPHLLPNEMFKKLVLDCWIRCTFVCLYCLLNLNFIILNKLNQILDYNEIHWTCNYVACPGAQQGVILPPALLLASSLLGIETLCDNNKYNNTNDYLLTDYQV